MPVVLRALALTTSAIGLLLGGFLDVARSQTLLCTVDSVVTGTFSGACGNSAVVTGNYDFTSGYLSKITGNNSVAYGAYSFAGGDNAVAIGAHATASNASPYTGVSNATAIGANSLAGVGGSALGANSSATGTDAIAYGHSATANQSLAMAIGFAASATAASAIAIGPNASATAAGSIALGSGSIANVANTISVGAPGSERKIVNIADGAISALGKEAITGGQLYVTNTAVGTNTTAIATLNSGLALTNTNSLTTNTRIASAFGGGSVIDAGGTFTSPSYTLFGTTYTNVGSALGAVETRTNTNTGDIASIWSQLGQNGPNLVRQDASTRDIFIGASTDGGLVNIAGTSGPRKLTGLLAGTLSGSSTDAVTGAQLNATNTGVTANTTAIASVSSSAQLNATNLATANQRIASAFGGGSVIDAGGTFTLPSYTLFGTTYTNVGSALGAVETRTNTNTGDIASIWSQLGQNGPNLVRQDASTRDISIGANTDGGLVNIAGTSGPRKLTGLLAGTLSGSSTDAVTGAQLNATNTGVTANTTAIASVSSSAQLNATNLATANQRIASAFGGGSVIDAGGTFTSPSYTLFGTTYTNVGSALGAVETRTNTNTGDIASIWSQLGQNGPNLVRQDASTRDIFIGANTDGGLVNIAGTSGPRKLTGLLAGTLSGSSTDAVTGAQLNATNTDLASASTGVASLSSSVGNIQSGIGITQQRIAAAFGGGSTIDGSGVFTAPNYAILGSNYASVGGALSALNARVQTNSTNISNLMAGTGMGGGSGLVVQDPATRAITVAATTDGAIVNVAGSDGARTVTGVAAGNVSSSSNDAVNGTQLNATNAVVAANASYATNAAAGLAVALGGTTTINPDGTVSTPQFTVLSHTYSSVASAFDALDASVATTVATVNNMAVSVSNVTANTRFLSITGTGAGAAATGTEAIALGASSTSSGASAVAIGVRSRATAAGAIAVGSAAAATGTNAIAIGVNAVATGSVALGVNTLASNGGAALGDYSVATGADSAALGPKSVATAANSAAIGSGSVADVPNTVSVGAPGNERRVTNVAAGIDRTDAVNVGQLNDYQSSVTSQISRLDQRVSKANGGVAMAMALAGSSLPENKDVGVAINVGAFGGQAALGISHYMRLNRNVVFSGGVGIQQNQVGGRAGMMVAW